MHLCNIIFKTVFFYFFILFIYRIMGKREIGKLSIQDLAVSLLIIELIAISIENDNDSLINTVLPILLLTVLEISMAFISLKSNRFRNFVLGKPSLIINRGSINYKEMIKQRYTLDDLLLELRMKGIKSIDEVEYASLENNGKLSIFKYEINDSIPYPLILDGALQHYSLKCLNKDEKWIYNIISSNNYKVEDIFYCFYRNDKTYIILKKDII